MRGTALQTLQSGEKDGQEVLQAPEVRFSFSLAQPMVEHRNAEIRLQVMEETHTRAGGFLKEGLSPWETCAGEDSWQ